MSKTVWVEFIRDYKCFKEGEKGEVSRAYALALEQAGHAKRLDKPPRHKMIEHPEKEKRHYYTG